MAPICSLLSSHPCVKDGDMAQPPSALELSEAQAQSLLDRLASGDLSPSLRAKLDRVRRALAPQAPNEPRIEGDGSMVEQGARARLPVIVGGALTPNVTISSKEQRPIRRLKMKHRRVIALHVEGLSYAEISKCVNLHPATIGAILRNPTVKTILARIHAEYDDLIRGLKPLVYESLRDALRNGSRGDRLKAIDRWGKITGEFKDDLNTGQTAEEVVRMLLKARHERPDGSAMEETVEVQVG